MIQDARLEAALGQGVERLVDLVAGVLPGDAAALLDAVRPELAAGARGVLLDVLAALGVDTSAHVQAPEVQVRFHGAPTR